MNTWLASRGVARPAAAVLAAEALEAAEAVVRQAGASAAVAAGIDESRAKELP
jgi:AmiR/NasT family two-component response regulator